MIFGGIFGAVWISISPNLANLVQTCRDCILKNLKRGGVDQDGSGLWVQRTIQENWFEVKTQMKKCTCFENPSGSK